MLPHLITENNIKFLSHLFRGMKDWAYPSWSLCPGLTTNQGAGFLCGYLEAYLRKNLLPGFSSLIE